MGVIKQKMIYRFLTSLTHVTPIKNNNVPFANVISYKNLTKRSWPWKESHPWRNLRSPYQPPREIKSRRVERKIKNANLKTSTPCWLPTKLIKANPPHFRRVNSVHKPIKRFFLPILGWTTKMKSPMNPPTRPTHNLTKESLALLRQWSSGKASLREQSPHHTCFQNFTLVPSPTSYRRSLEKFNQPLLINLHKLTPYTLVTFFVHQPP